MSSISTTYAFEFNVLDKLQSSKTFEWFVGEGPLYWYRIFWKEQTLGQTCTPSISECIISSPEHVCKPPCVVNEGEDPCKTVQLEVWHVLATSIEDLCVRLNTECCNRQLKKPWGKDMVFKKVQRYDRPALCCDVDEFIEKDIPFTDDYFDVDFYKCECVSWVDGCDQKIIVPCSPDVPEVRCGISSNEMPPDVFSMTMFGLLQSPMDVMPGFVSEKVEVLKPQVDAIITQCGVKLPTTIKLKHNIPILKDSYSLVYNKSTDSWQNMTHLKEWRIFSEWSCVKHDWRLNMIITKGSQKSKILLNLNTDNKRKLEFTFNPKSQNVLSKQLVLLKSKVVLDEIGLFRKELKFAIEG